MKIREAYKNLLDEAAKCDREADLHPDAHQRMHLRANASFFRSNASSLANTAAPFVDLEEEEVYRLALAARPIPPDPLEEALHEESLLKASIDSLHSGVPSSPVSNAERAKNT